MISLTFALLGFAFWAKASHSLRFFPREDALVSRPVNTTSGVIVGRTSPHSASVVEYLGIRFAETTEGSNRFLPPKRYSGEGIITATRYSPSCPQGFGGGLFGAITSYLLGVQSSDEDCLFLNVWARPVTNERLRPVMLWIYGGAFTTGDASLPIANGAALANDHDVIVVAPNYRVGIFGFPGAPELEHKNPGLLDQRMAVEWVRDNIAAFGGDPNRITLFGESAGGSSVDYYSYAWPEDPIVNGFVVQSGTAMMGDLFKSASDAGANWYKTTTKLGCGAAGVPKEVLLKCVRSKSTSRILEALPSSTASGLAALVPAFAPAADGKTVFSNVYERAKEGRFAKKPLLIGSNQNESTLFVNIGRITQPFYGSDHAGARHLERDFRCGTAIGAKARAQHGVPVWRYLFANNARGSNVGATHGAEVGIVFGNEKSPLKDLLQDAWIRFVKDPAHGLSRASSGKPSSTAWPEYNSTSKRLHDHHTQEEANDLARTLIRIAPDQKAMVDFVEAMPFDQICDPSPI